ncbi:hypothetical protein V6N13_072115 [Hibiscus sabdariffa]|uniref:Uncharacterized protein n=1 Tax=Hibiscus sabdariffa TaxID=183260 RepID=A0ABR2TBK4_9ROSI
MDTFSFLNPIVCSPLHCITSHHRHDCNIHSIAKGLVFTGSDSKRIRVWRQSDCTERGCTKTSSGEIWAILAYGNKLFTAHRQAANNIKIISCKTYYHAERVLYTGSYDRTVKGIPVHETKVNATVVNQDDGCVFTCSSVGSVKIWRILYSSNHDTEIPAITG